MSRMRAFWISVTPFFTLLAQAQEEAVDLGAMEETRPSWNPYSVTHNPWFIVVPAIGMIFVLIHLYRRDRRPKSNLKKVEAWFND